jgi:uncharacterized protein YjbI with pentapeptide repeats
MSKIYHINGTLLFEDEKLSLRELVEKNKKSLRGANLEGANLEGANLEGANLRGAGLRGANLSSDNAWLLQAKQNILYIFSYLASEVPILKQKIIEGRIDGTQYEGECCCLIGSLGNGKAESVIPYYKKGLHNTGEQLFWQIKEGDMPEITQFSKIALELCDEFLETMKIKEKNNE